MSDTLEELELRRPMWTIQTGSLRDDFAAAALQGLLANGVTYMTPQEVSELAFGMADAMMEQRNSFGGKRPNE